MLIISIFMSILIGQENNISDNMEEYPKEFIVDYSEESVAPKTIFTRGGFKNFLSSHTVQNDEKIKRFKGLKLLNDLKPKLKELFAEHGAIKYYAVARLVMKKELD